MPSKAALTATDDGAETTGANYDGIPGTVYCLGTDCKVDSNGKLAGSWYFTPTSTRLRTTGRTGRPPATWRKLRTPSSVTG